MLGVDPRFFRVRGIELSMGSSRIRTNTQRARRVQDRALLCGCAEMRRWLHPEVEASGPRRISGLCSEGLARSYALEPESPLTATSCAGQIQIQQRFVPQYCFWRCNTYKLFAAHVGIAEHDFDRKSHELPHTTDRPASTLRSSSGIRHVTVV